MTRLLRKTAKPGDICILLIPVATELRALRQQQAVLQAQYGGRIYEDIHLTCQRFTPPGEGTLADVVQYLTENFSCLPAFPLFADVLAQFYSAFWQTYVLRWQVQETPKWRAFRTAVETTLKAIDCPPHYTPEQRATCSALEMNGEVTLNTDASLTLPCHLFTAKQIIFSQIKAPNAFEILGQVELSTDREAK